MIDRPDRLLAIVGFVALLGGTGEVVAQSSGDYDPDNDKWNGLSQFVERVDGATDGLERPDTLDYGSLTPDQALLFVYPTSEFDVDSLASYVIDGGRVLLADDFGESDAFLDRLDIERRVPGNEGLPHGVFVGDNEKLPIFRPRGVHPLLEGVDRVVANHPVVLRHRGGPVVPYEGGGGVVFDMNLGAGKVVVIGDASMLINHMLGLADNGRLVDNAISYLCEGRSTCRTSLFVGDVPQSGSYADEEESSDEPFDWVGDAINEAIAEAQRNFPSSPLLYYLALVLTVGLVLYLAAIFSLRRSRRYSEFIDEALDAAPEPQSEFEWNVDRFDASSRETNFALPLSILKENFEELFLKDLGVWELPREERPTVETLAHLFAERHLDDRSPEERRRIETEVRKLLATYTRIPTRHRVYLDSDAYFSVRDLVQTYRRTMRTLELMGLEEEYERRTRPTV